MSDTNDDDARARHQRALLHGAPQPAPRQPQPGELLCEFYSETRKKFYRIILRDRGQYGVEAQLLDPVEMLYGHLFPARQLAIAWAEEQRKAIEKNESDSQSFGGSVVGEPDCGKRSDVRFMSSPIGGPTHIPIDRW
jgi:hypothetical protein